MKIRVQLENEYHQNGKNKIPKIYVNFRFLVQILVKIIQIFGF